MNSVVIAVSSNAARPAAAILVDTFALCFGRVDLREHLTPEFSVGIVRGLGHHSLFSSIVPCHREAVKSQRQAHWISWVSCKQPYRVKSR